MCLCLLTDGTKQILTRERQTENREKEDRNQGDRRGVCDHRKLLGHLEAAHAIKRDVREYRKDENMRREVGAG